MPGPTAVPVPDELEELLTPQWLNVALQPRFPGVVVTAVHVGRVVRRVSVVAEFSIECAGGVPAGLSPYLVAKGYFGESLRHVRHVGEPEAYFYRHLAGPSGTRTLRCVYADIDLASHHGVVITEDLNAVGGSFLGTLSDFPVQMVADSLEQYAMLHAATWSNPAYADVPALATRFAGLAAHFDADFLKVNIDGPLGGRIAAEARNAHRLYQAYLAVVALSAAAPSWAVIHGDAHVGNIMLDPDGHPGIMDWQLVQRGAWFMDVGYHLGSAMSVDDRRRHETDLLRHYLGCLAARGVDAPTFEEAQSLIGFGMVHGMFLWAITRQVSGDIIATMLERLGAGVADHNALTA